MLLCDDVFQRLLNLFWNSGFLAFWGQFCLCITC
nr:MAG TPA: Sterol regulatory element-binding protein [Caudoviricetes sp.]